MKNSRAILVILALALSSPCFAQNEAHRHDVGEKLGSVSFPTSCVQATRAQFERGVALLNSIEYEQASKQFQEIEKKDPHCAMAYWGQAMSLYHQLWSGHPRTISSSAASCLPRRARSILQLRANAITCRHSLFSSRIPTNATTGSAPTLMRKPCKASLSAIRKTAKLPFSMRSLFS